MKQTTMKISTKNKKQPRKPRKITPRYLENASLAYLQRFASSSENLRRILKRKAERSCNYHETDLDEALLMIDELIIRYKSSGLLNDESYTQGMVASLRRRGGSKRAIIARLRHKGLPLELINETLDKIDSEINEHEISPEMHAGFRYAKRRRLGPFRTQPSLDRQDKELASMGRAGFSYEIAKAVINCSTEDLPEL